MTETTRRRWAALGLCGLVIVGWWWGVRDLELHMDELWNLWQSFGTPAEILARTPFDWPPLSFLTLAAWRVLAGDAPVAVRAASWLTIALAAALIYRVGADVAGPRAGRQVLLAFGASGYVARIATEVRGYALSVAATVLALWLAERAFRARWGPRAVLWLAALGAACALHLWTYLPGALALLGVGLWTLVRHPARVWRWAVAATFGLVLGVWPLLWLHTSVSGRIGRWPWPDYADATWSFFRAFTTYRDQPSLTGVWLVVFALALAGLLARRHGARRAGWATLAWSLTLPPLLAVTHRWLGFYQSHYGMGVVVGWALLAGVGLARWGRRAEPVFVLTLIVLALWPTQIVYYDGFWRPWLAQSRTLDARLRPGDVFIVDAHCCSGNVHEIDTVVRLLHPRGLPMVSHPGDARRVWYLHNLHDYHAPTMNAVEDGRMAREFVGPSYHFMRLYEAPPDRFGVPAGTSGLHFHGAELVQDRDPLVTRTLPHLLPEQAVFTVRLWWHVATPTTLDYSVNVALLSAADGTPLATQDGPPAPRPLDDLSSPWPWETSRWPVGAWVADDRVLVTPSLPQGMRRMARLRVTLYHWETPNAPLAVFDDVLLLALDAW